MFETTRRRLALWALTVKVFVGILAFPLVFAAYKVARSFPSVGPRGVDPRAHARVALTIIVFYVVLAAVATVA